MNRTDRLYALVEELRASGERGRTSTALADRFEVSPRTIKRDVSALQQAGLPIWAAPGPRGGYRMIEPTSPLPPLSLTVGEAAAIAVALNTQADLPFATEGASALTKILGALGPDGERATTELLDRVWTTTRRQRSRAARDIDTAIKEQRVVVLTYAGADGEVTVRRVDPLQFANTGGHWYLLAYCRLRQGGRWFRLDRITDARLTKERSQPYDVATVIGTPPPEARPVSASVAGVPRSPTASKHGSTK